MIRITIIIDLHSVHMFNVYRPQKKIKNRVQEEFRQEHIILSDLHQELKKCIKIDMIIWNTQIAGSDCQFRPDYVCTSHNKISHVEVDETFWGNSHEVI